MLIAEVYNYMIKFLIKDLANNDNEVVEVRRNRNEYKIVVNYWDGSTFYIQTLNCTEIMYNPQLVSEIGDIDINDREYKFKSVCSYEVFLRVCADSFVLVDKEKKELDNEKRAESLIKKLGFDFDNIPKKEIRRLLEDEINDFQEGSSEYIRLLCGYLFCLGDYTDADLIEKAKNGINFDVSCMIDGKWIDNLRNSNETGERSDIIQNFVEYYRRYFV